MRQEHEITGADLDEILKLTSDDICSTLIVNYFSKPSATEDPRFLTNDYFILPKSRFNTKKDGYTTIGIYLCNLHLIQPNFSEIFGYVNKPFNGDQIKKIESKLSNSLYYKKITTDQFADYLNRIQWLGGNKIMTLITPSLTKALLSPVPGIEEYKKKLFNENKDAIEKGDALTGASIEKELIKYATDYLKKDEGYENFAAKSKMNINNNYKTMYIMKGPLRNTFDGEYRINSSDYNSGIKKSEYSSLADSSVYGAHSRAVGTAAGGYLAKKSNQTMNHVCVGPKGSDCGTKELLKVTIYPGMEATYTDRYIVENGKLKQLTPDNIHEYTGKTVDMRSPMFCHEKDCYCNICMGDQAYNMDLKTFGLAMNRLPNTLLNFKLKSFHDLTVKKNTIDIDTIFEFH